MQASLAVVKLQEQLAAVVGAAQSAGQHLIIDQQLSEAVSIIKNSANGIQKILNKSCLGIDFHSFYCIYL